MSQLSPHFQSEEFACHDNARTPVPRAYLPAVEYLCKEILEPMRDRFGPCTVNSGFRTAAHNRSIPGSARNSFHVYTIHDADDVAADVWFSRGSVNEWVSHAEQIYAAKRNDKGGIGRYLPGNFVHLDTRDYEARWNGS